MNEGNQWTNSNASESIPVRRKRGRPRKYPRAGQDHGDDNIIMREQNITNEQNIRVPPGFVVNGNQSREVNLVNDANDIRVGQAVHGVIDGAFDAGYLLTVRVGNTETTLRGVVFKPGHFLPVSADNDVAPGVPMIRRNEIPIPNSNSPRATDRNGTAYMARAVASKGKQVSSVVPQTAHPSMSRGHVVPVVLQPVPLSNGVPATSKPSSAPNQVVHPVASKGKEMLDAVNPSKRSTHINQAAVVENQVVPPGLQNARGPSIPDSAEALHEAEVQLKNFPGMPFEKLLTEVMKTAQVPSQLMETDSSSGGKLSTKDTVGTAEDDDSDTDEPLSVEPLRTVQPVLHNHPVVVSRPLGNYRTGKMTELLRENMVENQATSAGFKLDGPRNPEAGAGNEENGSKEKPSQAPSV